ncbi:hypothetical protein BGZ63DRAFT_400753 [Mariannaea sp. PMI_226]|nr:hypothetical protein BGZ63DRAFT_400753 [Mariannaea sp. PMI_226]
MTSSPSAASLTTSIPSSKLLDQADALAKMTFELNLRTVGGHAERLERDIQALVLQTKNDKEFQRENHKRFADMMAEIQSVKAHMATVKGGQEHVEGSFEQLQRETTCLMEGFREELKCVKGGLDEMLSQLEQLATLEDVRDEIQASLKQNLEVEDKARQRSRNLQIFSTPHIKTRIQEAINSTRRWNRDHKTTQLSDSQFTINYLKKQSQRDPAIAVLLQRSLLKRVRLRGSHMPGRSWSQPQNLEELCQNVAWKDVIDMVKNVLVVNELKTIGLLRQASGP